MGLSASQARYLSLVAQQTNLEYQGQQINQERTVLSQQVTDLYNSLLNMQVPTPPSKNDFTDIQYKGQNGSTTFSIGSIKPTADGKYTIERVMTLPGNGLQQQYGEAKVDFSTTPPTVGGLPAYAWEAVPGNPDLSKMEEAIRNTFGDSYTTGDFSVLVETIKDEKGNDQQIYHLVLTSDMDDGFATVYDVTTGSYTVSDVEEGCNILFDSSGRITSIEFPLDNGKMQKIEMTAVQITNEDAYDDAMAQYEYEQYLYDKEQAEINARTEVIQQQDRNLELKLQRLDNQRKQITTELEALEKVIDENIEKSYKTFNG